MLWACADCGPSHGVAAVPGAGHHPAWGGGPGIVAEFLSFGINSILNQRGIYMSETFNHVEKYGFTLLNTTDPVLMQYLNNVVEQLKDWLYKCSVQYLMVVISNIEDGEVLERW